MLDLEPSHMNSGTEVVVDATEDQSLTEIAGEIIEESLLTVVLAMERTYPATATNYCNVWKPLKVQWDIIAALDNTLPSQALARLLACRVAYKNVFLNQSRRRCSLVQR